jgi:UDP:flavonoid glycosyltransferase YjiC (YdhE family)
VRSLDQSMWSDEELREYVAAEVAYFRAHGVHVAVTGWVLTALISTRLTGIPLVTEHSGSFLPPVFERGLLPAPSQGIGLPFERWLPERVRRYLFNAGAARLSLYTGGFNRIAAELGVEGVPSFPALLLGDLTLVTDIPEVLGIPRDDLAAWTPRDPERYRDGTKLRYVGPMFARLRLPVSERVEKFLAGPHPIVYLAMTSTSRDLITDVIAMLRPLDAWIVVAATVHDLRELEDDRVLVEGLLPSHAIMPRVDLAVITGGQGSVQTALASGVPFIGVPLQPEQDANVVFAERQGAARRLSQTAARTPALAQTARAILADDRCRSCCSASRGTYSSATCRAGRQQ